MPCKKLPRIFQEISKNFLRNFQEFYKKFPRIFQEIAKNFPRIFEEFLYLQQEIADLNIFKISNDKNKMTDDNDKIHTPLEKQKKKAILLDSSNVMRHPKRCSSNLISPFLSRTSTSSSLEVRKTAFFLFYSFLFCFLLVISKVISINNKHLIIL